MNSKMQYTLRLRLLCLILSVAFLLSGCLGAGTPDTTDSTSSSQESTDVTTEGTSETTTEVSETTEVTEETTEATEETEETTETTEETTEATEETTEPTEETTEPTQPSGGTTPGGTGGFEGGETGTPDDGTEDGTTTPVELPVPEVGSEKNPFAEAVGELPASLSTVQIPADGTVWYYLINAQGTELVLSDPDIYVVLNGTKYTVPAAEDAETTEESQATELKIQIPAALEEAPVILQIGNAAAENKCAALTVNYGLGTEQNPMPLESVEKIEVTFAATEPATRTYAWIAEESCILTLKVESVTPETGEGKLELYCGETAGTWSEDGTEISVEVPRGEKAIITVTGTEGQESQIVITGTTQATAGAESNPILIQDLSVPFLAEIPAGEIVYYAAYISDMDLTIENAPGVAVIYDSTTYGADANGKLTVTFPAVTGRPQQVVFAVSNGTAEDAVYTLAFTYPVGSVENPDQLVIGENTAVIDPDDEGGYNYSWTAEATGKLTITMSGDNWQYVLNNLTTGVYGDLMDASLEPSAAVAELEVTEGDEISLYVNGFTSEDVWALPGGTVVFNAAFKDNAGTEENPIVWTSGSPLITETIPAGETVYYSMRGISGQLMTCEDTDASVTVDGAAYDGGVIGGNPRNPVTLAVTNNGSEEKSFTLTFALPLGTVDNPEELTLGDNTATLEANNSEGYHYTWTAPEDGKLTVTILDATWQYVVDNYTSGVYGSQHFSDDEEPVPSETIEVTSGAVIHLMVNTYVPGQWDTPAGEVHFTATFKKSAGTEENPIVWTSGSPLITETIPAGETVYYSMRGISGQLMTCEDTDASVTVDGAAYDGGVIGGNPRNPVTLAVTNNGSEEKSFTLTFALPLGTVDNPEELTLGDNTATLEANNSEGYHYTWTAPEDGKLTVTILDATWQYVVDNYTSGVYGSQHFSDDEEPVPSETIEVTSGAVIHLMVNTYVPGQWDTPAGEVNFQVSFTKAPKYVTETLSSGTLQNSLPVISSGVLPYNGTLQLTVSSVTDADGNPVNYTVDYSNSFTASNTRSIHAGSTEEQLNYNASAGCGYSWTLSENLMGDIAVTYELTYTHLDMGSMPALGSALNPKRITDLTYNSVSLAAGDSDGYYFVYTAEEDGYLCFEANEELDLTVTNRASAETVTMWQVDHEDEDVFSAPCFVRVDAGDPIVIHVVTHEPGAAYGSISGCIVEGTDEDGESIAVSSDIFMATMLPEECISFVLPYQGMNVVFYGEDLVLYNPDSGITYTDSDGDGIIAFTPESTGEPMTLTITNTVEDEPRSFEIVATYPLGSKNNPESIGTGTHTLVSEESNAGWEYVFVPQMDGIVKFTVESATNGWQYALDGNVIHCSDDTQLCAVQYISVAQGYPVSLFLGTYNGSASQWPAGSITFSIEYVTLGTQEAPIVYDASFPLTTGRIPVGGVVYYQLPASTANMALTIHDSGAYVVTADAVYSADTSGVVTVSRLTADVNGNVLVGIGNAGSSAVSYQVYVSDPIGSFNSPDSLNLCESNGYTATFTVEIPAAADGYYYSMWADFDGTVTVTVSGATNGWQMQLSKPYSGYSGTVLTGSETGADSVAVTAQDCAYLMLNSVDSSGGSVTFTVTFTPASVEEAVQEQTESAVEEAAETPEA